jgi:hypothetical protein
MEGHIRSSAIKGRHTSIQAPIQGMVFSMVAGVTEVAMIIVMVKSLVVAV